MSLLTLTPVLQAQPPVRPPAQHPGDEKLVLPDFQDNGDAAELALPRLEPAEQGRPLSAQLRIYVKQFRLMGNTVFSDKELASITDQYSGRVISSAELQQLRHRLSLYYIKRGYINSGVIIPDQQISDNEITLQVIEGKLTDIQTSGNKRLRRDYLTSRIGPATDAVLNVNDLQQRLQLLKQNPLIQRINAELGPGILPGQSILRIHIQEADPYQVSATINNHDSPSVSSERLQVDGYHRNLTGRGDALAASLGVTEGLNDISLSYKLPLNASDTTLGLRYEQSDSAVIEEPFKAIDIESDSRSFALSLREPVYKTTTEELAVSITMERRRSETSLLGVPFSFSPGVKNGKSDISVLRIAHEWLQRSRKRVIAARSQFSQGLKIFGATENASAPDGNFLTWLGQFQWVQRTGDQNHQFILGANIQLSSHSLLPLEKFSVGGVNSVRGYRENQLVRDNGIVASFEYRMPFMDLGESGGRIQIAPFIDTGLSWNNGQSADKRAISSVGFGLLWDVTKKMHAELYLAKAFKDFTQQEHDLQDSGIHFLFRYNFL